MSSIDLIIIDPNATELEFTLNSMIGTLMLGGLLVLYTLATLIPNLSLSVRRFHDAGLSGWWYVIPYIIVSSFSIILDFVETSSGIDLIMGCISIIFGIAEFVVLVLPTDKMMNKSLKE